MKDQRSKQSGTILQANREGPSWLPAVIWAKPPLSSSCLKIGDDGALVLEDSA